MTISELIAKLGKIREMLALPSKLCGLSTAGTRYKYLPANNIRSTCNIALTKNILTST